MAAKRSRSVGAQGRGRGKALGHTKPKARTAPVGRAGGTAVRKSVGLGPVKAYGAPTRSTTKPGQRAQRAKAATQGQKGAVRVTNKVARAARKVGRKAKQSARKSTRTAKRAARRKPTPSDFSRHM